MYELAGTLESKAPMYELAGTLVEAKAPMYEITGTLVEAKAPMYELAGTLVESKAPMYELARTLVESKGDTGRKQSTDVRIGYGEAQKLLAEADDETRKGLGGRQWPAP